MSQVDIVAQISKVNQELQQIDKQIFSEKKEIEQLTSEHQSLSQKCIIMENQIQEIVKQLADEEMKGNDLKILVAHAEKQNGINQKEIDKEREKVKQGRLKNIKLVDEFVLKCKKQMQKCSNERRIKFKDKFLERQIEADEKILKIKDRVDQLSDQKTQLEKELLEIEKENQTLQDEVKLQKVKLTQQTQQQIKLQQQLFDKEEEIKQEKEEERKQLCSIEYEIDIMCEEMALQEVEIQQLEGQRWRQELENQDVKQQIETINRQIYVLQAQRRLNAQQQRQPIKTRQVQTDTQQIPLQQIQIQQVQSKQYVAMSSMGNSTSHSNVAQKGVDEMGEVQVKIEGDNKRQEAGRQVPNQKVLPKQNPPLKRKPTRTSRKKQHQKVLKMVQPKSGKQKAREEIQDEEDDNRNNQFDLFGGRLQ